MSRVGPERSSRTPLRQSLAGRRGVIDRVPAVRSVRQSLALPTAGQRPYIRRAAQPADRGDSFCGGRAARAAAVAGPLEPPRLPSRHSRRPRTAPCRSPWVLRLRSWRHGRADSGAFPLLPPGLPTAKTMARRVQVLHRKSARIEAEDSATAAARRRGVVAHEVRHHQTQTREDVFLVAGHFGWRVALDQFGVSEQSNAATIERLKTGHCR